MRRQYETLEESTKKFIRDIIINALAGGVVILVGAVIGIVPVNYIIVIVTTFFLTSSAFLFFNRRNKTHSFVSELGITGLWRDEEYFNKSRGVSYTEYCRQFIKEAQDGETIRILGYDWVEVFSDTTVLANDVLIPNGKSRFSFEVILVDPESPMALEKRSREMTWKTQSDNLLYPEGSKTSSLLRLRTKIANCVTVAEIFEQERPQYFDLKKTPTSLSFSFIMRADKAIGVIYTLPWKGKDSIIFEVAKSDSGKDTSGATRPKLAYGTDFYGFLQGYFESLWQSPGWQCVEVSEKQELAH